MTTQAPVRLEAGACALPPEEPSVSRRRLRGVVNWLLFAIATVFLWPAQWGGLIGLTVVNGHSMEPAYYTSDLIVTLRHGSYEVGETISYTIPDGQAGAGGHVIHRIIDVDTSSGERVYTTQGDNNATADQWAISASDITGAVLFRVPGVGDFLGTWLIVLIVAAALGGIVAMVLWPSGEEDPADEDPGWDEDTSKAQEPTRP